MQNIWARVVQIRCDPICVSRLCGTTGLALGRRKTAATFGYRLRSLDVFTVLYSSVLVTAAVADSARKTTCRNELDKAVEGAREELKALEDQQQSRLDALLKGPDAKSYRLVQGGWPLEDEHKRREAILSCDFDEIRRSASQGRWLWSDIFEWEAREVKVRETLGLENWKGIHLNVLENLSRSQLEYALLNDSLLIRIAGNSKVPSQMSDREEFPLSWKKIRTMEWSTVKLAYIILQYAHDSTRPNRHQSKMLRDRPSVSENMENGAAGPSTIVGQAQKSAKQKHECLESRIRQASYQIKQLRQIPQESNFNFQKFKAPPAPKYGLYYNHEQTILLNSFIADIFQEFRNGCEKLTSSLVKIGFKLLLSDTLPNVQTYTILINNFTAVGLPQLVKRACISMNECHIRPNSEFLTSLLRFSSQTGDIEFFKRLTARMKGFRKGLALTNPNTEITPATVGKYRFMTGLRKGSDNYTDSRTDPRDSSFPKDASRKIIRIYEKAEMNQEVYEALIDGALKFYGHKQAMVNYINMISEGYEPSVRILLSVLQNCCNQKDWESGCLVWQKIQTPVARAGFSEYYWILRLCQRCRKKGMYHLLLKEGAQQGILPPLIRCFPEEAEVMDVDVLLESANEHMELRERLKSGKSFIEPVDRLWKYLGVISYEIVDLARQFRDIELSARGAPFMAHALAKKLNFERDKIIHYAYTLDKEKPAQRGLECEDIHSNNSNNQRDTLASIRYGQKMKSKSRIKCL